MKRWGYNNDNWEVNTKGQSQVLASKLSSLLLFIVISIYSLWPLRLSVVWYPPFLHLAWNIGRGGSHRFHASILLASCKTQGKQAWYSLFGIRLPKTVPSFCDSSCILRDVLVWGPVPGLRIGREKDKPGLCSENIGWLDSLAFGGNQDSWRCGWALGPGDNGCHGSKPGLWLERRQIVPLNHYSSPLPCPLQLWSLWFWPFKLHRKGWQEDYPIALHNWKI